MTSELAKPALVAATVMTLALVGCGQQTQSWDSNAGVAFQKTSSTGIRDLINTAVSATPAKRMNSSGLAGVMGGIELKVLRAGEHNLLMPLPQMADSQAPVAYAIACAPEEALAERRILDRGDRGCFVNLRLKGTPDQEVKIGWAAVVLIGNKPFVQNQARAKDYLAATACAQAEDKQLKGLADKLWPADGKAGAYARQIQEFIRKSKQKSQPRSLDAVGILESGANGICTANANLAAALMRAKHVPCRSIAVVPPISQRLEMHRVVEYFEDGGWVVFDPSLLQVDVPLKPWHGIIMAKPTMPDEQVSMKPRVGSAFGCPFGQEVELSDMGLTLFGNQFYWTIAAPLAEFEVNDEAVRWTVEAWSRFLKTGNTSAQGLKAALARNSEEYLAALNEK